ASLVVDGELSGSGSLVLNGGTLQGSGLVSKALTVDTGDVLSPGNSPGRLNFGSSQTWADGGTYLWEINDVDAGTGTGWDVVDITGSLDVTATIADPFVIEITSLSLLNAPDVVHDFDDLSSYTWTLLETTAGITGFNTDSFLLDTSGFVSVFTGTFAIDQLGDDLVINYTAVPEPGTVGLLAAALTWLSIQSRRRVYKVGI
ncbi:MAG: PEP-CTERM sorting domain-containing protein, partial [Verrucomicrobiota bacterium]